MAEPSIVMDSDGVSDSQSQHNIMSTNDIITEPVTSKSLCIHVLL